MKSIQDVRNELQKIFDATMEPGVTPKDYKKHMTRYAFLKKAEQVVSHYPEEKLKSLLQEHVEKIASYNKLFTDWKNLQAGEGREIKQPYHVFKKDVGIDVLEARKEIFEYLLADVTI